MQIYIRLGCPRSIRIPIHFEAPDISNRLTTLYVIVIFIHHNPICRLSLDLQALLVRQVQETDEAEAGADFVHLVLRVCALKSVYDVAELARFLWIRRGFLILMVLVRRQDSKESNQGDIPASNYLQHLLHLLPWPYDPQQYLEISIYSP